MSDSRVTLDRYFLIRCVPRGPRLHRFDSRCTFAIRYFRGLTLCKVWHVSLAFPRQTFALLVVLEFPIAGVFAAIFEGEFGDAGFVELAEAFDDHAVVLFLCGARERQIEAEVAR